MKKASCKSKVKSLSDLYAFAYKMNRGKVGEKHINLWKEKKSEMFPFRNQNFSPDH